MNYTERLSEMLPVVATIDPQSISAGGTAASDCVDMSTRRQAMFVLLTGAISTSGTVDCKIQQCTSTSAAGASDLASKAITQLAAASANKQAVIEVRAEEMGAAYRYLRAYVTVATSAALVALTAHAGNPRHAPDTADLSSVAEIVAD